MPPVQRLAEKALFEAVNLIKLSTVLQLTLNLKGLNLMYRGDIIFFMSTPLQQKNNIIKKLNFLRQLIF